MLKKPISEKCRGETRRDKIRNETPCKVWIQNVLLQLEEKWLWFPGQVKHKKLVTEKVSSGKTCEMTQFNMVQQVLYTIQRIWNRWQFNRIGFLVLTVWPSQQLKLCSAEWLFKKHHDLINILSQIWMEKVTESNEYFIRIAGTLVEIWNSHITIPSLSNHMKETMLDEEGEVEFVNLG